MTIYLKQSTASQEILLPRFVDSTDGNTEKTALTIVNTDIKVWKAGGTTVASKNSGGATHIANGLYYAVLDATDTDTLGSLVLSVHVSGALSVKLDCVVLAANVYDSLIGGGDLLQVDTTQVEGTDATNQIRDSIVSDATRFAGANIDVAISTRTKPADTQAAVTLVATTTNVTNDVGITQAGADKVWSSAARTLTSFGTLVADVWANATRTLTAFAFTVTLTDISTTIANKLADIITRRHTSDIEASADGDTLNIKSLYGLMARVTHKNARTNATTVTTYKADDSTSLATATIVTDAAQEPVSSIDPN